MKKGNIRLKPHCAGPHLGLSSFYTLMKKNNQYPKKHKQKCTECNYPIVNKNIHSHYFLCDNCSTPHIQEGNVINRIKL